MLSQEDFIARSKKAQKKEFDYSQTVYTGMTNKVSIICPEHGIFTQSPQTHIKGANGCQGCGHRGRKDLMNTERFIERAISVHGDNKFDYSDTSYSLMRNKVKVRCIKHNIVFDQLPQAHLKGLNGCRECNGQKPIDLERLVKRSEKVFGKDFFDYSLIDENSIKNMHSKISLRCIKHNEIINLTINSHLRGTNGCPKCNRTALRTGSKLENMIKSININDKYDYSLTDFSSNHKNKVTIHCNIHNVDFTQTLNGHLSGREGCSKCSRNSISKIENDFSDFIKSLGFDIICNSRKVLRNKKEVDIYIPSKKIAIEFNGVYWHSERFNKDKNYHYDKSVNAENLGIRLLHIWEDDWVYKRKITENHIRSVLGVSNQPRIYARNTFVKNITKNDARNFLNENHIQGFVGSSVYLGLFSDTSLVAVANFNKKGNDYVLDRYATSCSVIGGHSKLVSYFEKNYSYNKLITFADRTFSNGDLYRQTGWVVDGEVLPDYCYTINNERYHKSSYSKNRIKNNPNLTFEDNKTEKELAKLNGLFRIWDAGKVRFIKPHP